MTTKAKTYAFWIGLPEAVGALSGFLTRKGMQYFMDSVVKPPLSPPGWLFPVAWGSLYALMGIGAARISLSEQSRERSVGLNLFMVQLAVNFLWSPIFFNLRAYGLALAWLVLLLALSAAMAVCFGKVDRIAGWLQVPYLAWLIFAGYLNWGVLRLN